MRDKYRDATLSWKTEDYFMKINQDEKMKKVVAEMIKYIKKEDDIDVFTIRYNKMDFLERGELSIYLKTTQDYEAFLRKYQDNIEIPFRLYNNNQVRDVFLDLAKSYGFDEVCNTKLETYFYSFESIAKRRVMYTSISEYNENSEKIQILNKKNGRKRKYFKYDIDLVQNYYSDEVKAYLVFAKKKDYEKWFGTEIIQEIKKEVYEKIKEADVYDYIREEDYEFYVNLSPQGYGQYYFELEENLKTAIKV